MRGGTSRKPFRIRADLSADIAAGVRALLPVVDSPERRKIGSLGDVFRSRRLFPAPSTSVRLLRCCAKLI